MFINPARLRGLWDCVEDIQLLAVLPLETEYGRKRQIDQSSCNKDYSCAEGFCPSFVNVIGAKPKRLAGQKEIPAALALLPEPTLAAIPSDGGYNILIAGIGGTGVVTIAALLTMGAHLEGKAFSTIDQFGMAQKGGAVTSHVRIAAGDGQLGPARLSMGAADLIMGCDSLVTSGDLALATIDPARTHVLVNTHQAITGQFAMNPDLSFPADPIESRIRDEAGSGKADLIDASRLATALLGDSIMSNMFMLGYAYQKGLLPISSLALMRAIELNGHAIESNKAAFEWGRRTAFNPAAVAAIVAPATDQAPETLEALITHRMAELTKYQDAAYAARYEAVVRRIASAEAERTARSRQGLRQRLRAISSS